mmetsp:Transcript_61743/g.155900  ORF Transcript_61743/g.155900 Transcript_61743/m.155900 type:complete len:210 (-) Transcript_61743:1496-2125(-)
MPCLPRLMPSMEKRSSRSAAPRMNVLAAVPGAPSARRTSNRRRSARCTGYDRSKAYLPEGSSSNNSLLSTYAETPPPPHSSICISISSGAPGFARRRMRERVPTTLKGFRETSIRCIWGCCRSAYSRTSGAPLSKAFMERSRAVSFLSPAKSSTKARSGEPLWSLAQTPVLARPMDLSDLWSTTPFPKTSKASAPKEFHPSSRCSKWSL